MRRKFIGNRIVPDTIWQQVPIPSPIPGNSSKSGLPNGITLAINATAPRLSETELREIIKHLETSVGILDSDRHNLTTQEVSLKSMLVVIKRELETRLWTLVLQSSASASSSPTLSRRSRAT